MISERRAEPSAEGHAVADVSTAPRVRLVLFAPRFAADLWALLGILLPALILVALAYQLPFRTHASLAERPGNIELRGAHKIEGMAADARRWSTPNASLRFSGVGAGEYMLRLRFHGGAQAGAGRILTVRAGDGPQTRLLAAVAVRADWQELVLQVPAHTVGANGDLLIHLDIPALQAAGDPRALGVMLQATSLRPLAAVETFALRPPPIGRVAQTLLILLLAFGALRLVALRPLHVWLACFALTLALSAGLASARLDTAILLNLALRVLPFTLLLAGALRFIRWRSYSNTIRSNQQSFGCTQDTSAICNPAVLCAVLLIFTLRLGGLLHPQYILIDQRLRANQLQAIASGQADAVRPQLEQQYEWGTREPVPYSLLTYYMLVPLAWFWQGEALVTATEAASVLIDASVPLLLAALATADPRPESGRRRRPQTRGTVSQGGAEAVVHPFGCAQGTRPSLAGGFAALVYAALPIGYLFFHDGSFPTTIGVWLVLVALVAVRRGRDESRPYTSSRTYGLLVVALITLALVAYVTHIAFVPFLLLALSAGLWRLVGRRAALQLLLATGLALLVAWLLFYREYSVALVTRTIPAYLAQIAERGSVGRDTDLLYNTGVNSVGQHLWAHFRVWPALLALVGLGGLLLKRRGFLAALGLAYMLFLGATLLAERWFGLWNKHVYFAAPGVALLAGVALAWLWQRGSAGRAVCCLLLALLFWQSSVAWGNRTLWYILPAEAL